MSVSLMCLFIFIFGTLILVFHRQVTAEIIEHPQTQYIVKNHSTQFYCKTFGSNAYWVINNETVSSTHRDVKSKLEAKGFSFFTSSDQRYYNLTLSVLASTDTNNTLIECKLLDSHFNFIESNKAYLRVFNSFRPLSPALSIDMSYYNPSSFSPQICVLVFAQPLYPGYVISEFILDITFINSNKQLMKQIRVSNINGTYFHRVNLTLPNIFIHECSTVSIFATAINYTYGESTPAYVEQEIPAVIRNFSHNLVNNTVYFYPNGRPLLSLKIQFPTIICTHQDVNYTIQIKERSQQVTEFMRPFTHRGPGIVTQEISGLQRGIVYEAMVTIMSVYVAMDKASAPLQEQINTTVDLKFNPDPCNFSTTNPGHNVPVSYDTVTAISSMLVAIILVSATACVLLALYIYRRKKMIVCTNMSPNRICNSMVHNPVYDGPLYESVQPKFETLVADSLSAVASRASNTLEVSSGHLRNHPPTDCLSATSDKRDRYVDWSSFSEVDTFKDVKEQLQCKEHMEMLS